MRTRLVVSFFICFLLQACSGASTTKTNGVSNTSGNDQAGCIALDTIGIDGAVEKFVWNEEDGIGFLIQDNSYLDFIKSSFTSRPVFAMQAADGRITYSTEDLMKEMWPKERIEDPVSVVAWRPYGFALQEDGSFFLPVGVAQYDEKGCRSVPMLGRYRGNLAEMTLDFENMFSAVELRLRKDSFALEPIKVKQVILQGNDGEILAGSIKVVASRQELPDSVCEERKVSPCVVLDCGSGVELTEESTSFYLPVLPVEFRRGYSLTVVTDRDSGNMFRIQCGGKFPVRLKKGRIYRAADTIVRPAYLQYMIPDPNFFICQSLKRITFPDRMVRFGEWAFYENESLQSVCIPEGVTTIPSSAFARCHNLTCVIMPGSLQTICGGAFSQCHKLTDVTIPDGVTVIETGAFPSYLDMAVVTCLAVIPPELGKDNFGFPAKILYVPAGSVEVYRKNAVWREAFETIAALP